MGWLMVGAALILAAFLFTFGAKYEDCEEKGGVLMRDGMGMYHCMAKELP
jgi:hypothetical protein